MGNILVNWYILDMIQGDIDVYYLWKTDVSCFFATFT